MRNGEDEDANAPAKLEYAPRAMYQAPTGGATTRGVFEMLVGLVALLSGVVGIAMAAAIVLVFFKDPTRVATVIVGTFVLGCAGIALIWLAVRALRQSFQRFRGTRVDHV